MEHSIVKPSKPKIVEESDNAVMFEIDGLHPGYGHTLGNSLRRIILSSLPGDAVTSIKIDGVQHEFSTIDGVREDVINIILNLKRVRFKMSTDESQTVKLSANGNMTVTASDIELPGQVEVVNPDQVIANLTDKNAELNIEMEVERGIGFISKEQLKKKKVDIGHIAVDANFSPIRRVNYEVENMRVGDRTDYNRLRIFIETDGSMTPREVLDEAIRIMIEQLKAITGYQEDEPEEEIEELSDGDDESSVDSEEGEDENTELHKTRIESLEMSARTENALLAANVRTVGGLLAKTEAGILAIEGIGDKGLEEIKDALDEHDLTLKES